MKKDPRTLFGNKLRKLRKQRGWSQERLALESDLDRTYIGGVAISIAGYTESSSLT